MNQEIELGDVAKDVVTGLEGMVIGVTKWLNGCDRLIIQPRELKDGKPVETAAFDRPQLKLITKGAYTNETSQPPQRATGGPRPTPTRQ